MKKNKILILGLLLSIVLINFVSSSNLFIISTVPQKGDNFDLDKENSDDINLNPKLAQVSGNFSYYNLSVIIDEINSLVEGNLTVDFYNNDNVNFTRIPFHIYLSGMYYLTRPGSIVIVDVTDVSNPSISFPFNVYTSSQIMWVNLSETLVPQGRAQFIIQFNATIPDGGIDRANSHGSDGTQSRIYKFASFYPIPCVYDIEDNWNIDPYLTTGDPFYFDMAYYNFFIEAPSGMIVAATGNLEEKLDKGATTWYHFNPIYPVREVTFSASRYFQVQSKISNGVNVSTYFLPKDALLWSNYALNHAEAALILFNTSFGTYPYPTLNIVEEYTTFGGMEYPNQVYISESIDSWGYPLDVQRRLLEKIIIHEACHQWWYNLVGNDEVDVGFLDEGLTCWSTDYYGEYYYGDWEYFQYTRYIDSVRVYYELNGLSSKINQTVYECLATNTDYYYVAYSKAPLIFETLRQYLGLPDFLEGLKLYFESHQFELVLLSDIQQAFEDVVGNSLDWFFFPWFDNLFLPKYSITQNLYNNITQKLDITIIDLSEPLNDYSYSQQVPIYIYDTLDSLILNQTVWINGTTELSFSISNQPNKVSLIYYDYVLVQLADKMDLSLDSFVQYSYQVSGDFSNYNLSVIMDEANSMVEGNLTVDFYNNDNVNFTRVPFHIYLSGMDYDTRPGSIVIVNVTDVNNPNISFPFNVDTFSQIMWVNLSETLEPQKRAQFIIQFNATLPDGGIDRANSHGSDVGQTRIYKFASFYPIPCVYDNEDGWNTDPYVTTGDPFYFDMAYYSFFIEAPNGMIIAATGKLEEKLNKGATTWYHFDPIYPVREVTFSASRYFQVQSRISDGVNVSTYFLSKDSGLWENYALNHAEAALLLFTDSFGTYYYPTLNVVEEFTSFGGMEYPLQVYITEAIDGWGYPLNVERKLLEKYIVHEVCHQWWYNLIGNDEVDVGFLDEGLTCWSTDYYGEYYYGDWEYFQYTRYIDEVRVYYTQEGRRSKINQTVYECFASNTDYYYIAYHKAPLIFELLRQTIGLADFLDGLMLFFERYQFKLVILSDLQQTFEDVVGNSLDWFFFPWFDNFYLPKYAITQNIYYYANQSLVITIVDLNEPVNGYAYSQQVPLDVYDASNSLIFSQTVWINGTTRLSFTLSNQPNRVSLNYSNYVLVQIAYETDLSLDSLVQIIGGPGPQDIPGYEMTLFLIFSLTLIGLIIVNHRRKIKTNKYKNFFKKN